jgi:DNA (cytosine-5)-methyltransferase 1
MFAGIGGICLGFRQAGATVVWANEIYRYACATYRHNFPDTLLVEGDIRAVNRTTIPDIDVLTAGFPCQSFSVMGNQKGFADPRGTMYFEILRVIDAKRPKIVLMENVKNLVQHDSGRTFITIYNTLAERGYGAKYAVLGAHTHANIPQYRDRIFIAAFLDFDMMESFAFPGEVSLTAKINDLIDRNTPAEKHYYYTPDNRYYEALNSRMTDNTAIYRIDDYGAAKRAWRIAPTLKANMGTYHDRVPLVRDTYGIRKLTPQECLALQGFPKEFGFPDISPREIYKQLGNTVCVRLIKSIACNIKSLKS